MIGPLTADLIAAIFLCVVIYEVLAIIDWWEKRK